MGLHKNNNKLARLLIGYLLSFGLLLASNVYANTTVTVSDEAFGNNSAGRAAAATLDDDWAASLPSGIFNPDLFEGGTGYDGAKTIIDPTGAFYRVGWEVGSIDDTGPGTPTSTTFIKATSGGVTYGSSDRIQATAPNPVSEWRLSSNHSAPGLNAILLDFSESLTPIYELGIFIGDAESRINNGTAARMIVFDKFGNLLKDAPIIYTGTVLTGTGPGDYYTYTSVEPPGSPSGEANTPSGYWGNNTTAFVTVKSDQVIGKVIFQAGDDDHTTLNEGTQEQIGMTGILLPYEPYVPPAALPPEPVHPVFEANHQSQILPGNVLFYAHKFSTPNTGSVRFSSISSGNQSTGWAQRLYQDSNCDGVLNGNEGSADFYGTRLSNTHWESPTVTLTADDEICLINKVFAPANVAAYDRFIQQISAEFSDESGEIRTLTVQDVTTAKQAQSAATTTMPALGASALELRKTVQNLTNSGAETASINQALPGNILQYRIYYRNTGTAALSELVVNDSPPEYTRYQPGSISCHTPPSGMLCSPFIGTPALRWVFSGALKSGAQGVVSYQVQIDASP